MNRTYNLVIVVPIPDRLPDILHHRRNGIGRIEPYIGDHGGGGRDHVGRLAALLLGEGCRCAYQGVQFPAPLFADHIPHRMEVPEVCKDDPVEEGGSAAQIVEHLQRRFCEGCLEGMCLHFGAGHGQLPHWRMGCGHWRKR